MKPTPTSAMQHNIVTVTRTESGIYREESDDRKAEQRVRQELAAETGAAAESSDTAGNGTSTAAGTGKPM